MGRKIRIIGLFFFISMVVNANPKESVNNTDPYSPAVHSINTFNLDKITGSTSVTDELIDTSDDFNLPCLRSAWTLIADENTWSLKERPGFLRIKASPKTDGQNSILKNTFAQKLKAKCSGEAVCYFDLTNLAIKSKAGIFYSNSDMYSIGIEKIDLGYRIFTNIDGTIAEGESFIENSIIFRIQINATNAWFEYSFDGITYTSAGKNFSAKTLANESNFVGLYCRNTDMEGGSVDIDWFYFKHNFRSDLKYV